MDDLMLSILSSLLGLFPSLFGTVNKITDAIVNEKIKQIDAKTQQEQIASTERISALTAQRDILIAEAAHSNVNIFMRAFLGLPSGIVIWKLIVWDKVIGGFVGCSDAPRGTCKLFITDPLDDNQWRIIMIVIGFYFCYEIGMGVTKVLRR